MKRSIAFGALGALCVSLAAGALSAHAADVGVSISIGEPGYYGRIDIGNYPRPALVYPQPVVVQPQPHYAGAPLYLRVPPEQARHWPRFCNRYQACGQQVFFVRDDWYRNEYAPRYVRDHDRRGYREDERRGGERRDHDEGRGRGREHERHEGRGRD